MKKKILVIEDSHVDRALLSGFLSEKYKLIEADSGEEGLEILSKEYLSISVILLDLMMPDIDGYEVLKQIKKETLWQHIPVIITTSKSTEADIKKAVDLGAVGYVTKPYDHTILDTLIDNVIRICELSIIVNETYKDKLTGLYNRDAFLAEASKLIKSKPAGHFILSYLNIDHFKVINDQYGNDIGDKVLKHIAECLAETNEKVNAIAARFTGDKFVILFPAKYCDSAVIEMLHAKITQLDFLNQPITVRVGRYIVNDLSVPISTMYDGAMLAEASIQGKYDLYVAVYDESMRKALLHEQKIASTMVPALKNGEFEPWYQPQYNHATGSLIGAEALVRWRDPTDGHIIPPNAFIPVFEKNGFIYELDKYVWEQVCIQLRKWLDNKIETLPVSINISRMDIFHDELKDVIIGLINKYNIPIDLLRLEITESAFSEAPKKICAIVRELIDYGFTVEIDDFGSGYSSLNTLKDVPAQILKLDMKFFENSGNSDRGGNIIESIVRMAKWIGMSTIAEGVEEIAQADYLKSIGCYYIQGYLYAKPMPLAEYEKLLISSPKEETLTNLVTVEELNNNKFWDPKSMDTLIFNSYIGGACIFEYHNGQIELLRSNDRYIKSLGQFAPKGHDLKDFDIKKYFSPEEKRKFRQLLSDAIDSHHEECTSITLVDPYDSTRIEYIRITARLIAIASEQYLIYCVIENCTQQRTAEMQQVLTASQLQFLNDSAHDIIAQPDTEKAINKTLEKLMMYFSGDRGYVIEFTDDYSFSSNTYEVCATGVSHEIDNLQNIPFNISSTWWNKFKNNEFIVIENVDLIEENDLREILKAQSIHSLIVAPLFRDGKLIAYCGIDNPKRFINQIDHLIAMCDYISILITRRDLVKNVHTAETELLDNLPCGAALYEYDGKELTIRHLNKHYWELVGREKTKYTKISILDAVHPNDRQMISKEIEAAIRAGRQAECTVRILHKESEYKLFHIVARIVHQENSKFLIYASYTPVSENNMSLQELLPVALSAIMESSPDVTYIKDTDLHYISASPMFINFCNCNNAKDVFGKTDYDLFGKELGELYRSVDKNILETKIPIINKPDLIKASDDEWHNVVSSKYPILDEEGNGIGIYGIVHDITREKENESQLQLLSNSIPGGIAAFEYGPDGFKALYFNDGFFRASGYSRQEYAKKTQDDPLALIYPEDKKKILAIVHEQAEKKDSSKIFGCECRCKLKSGEYRWYSIRGDIVQITEDKIIINTVLIDIDDSKKAEEQLRVSEEEYRLAAQMGNNVICRFSIADNTVTLPPEIAKQFSLPEVLEDVPYGRVKLGKISTDTAGAFINFYEKIKKGEKHGKVTYRKLLPIGWRWFLSKFSTIFDKNGNPISAIVSFADVTEEREKEITFEKWKQMLQNRPSDSYTLFSCNIDTETMYDKREGSLLSIEFDEGTFVFDDHTNQYADNYVFGQDKKTFKSLVNTAALIERFEKGNRNISFDFREKVPTGDFRWLKLTIDLVNSPITDGIEGHFLFENIDKEKRAELQILERAETDPLTGVLNRITFEENVNKILTSSKPDSKHALLMLDLDNFKQVNDVFGHGEGDQVLIGISTLLQSVSRSYDLVGRLGGDEFVVFLRNIPNDTIAAIRAKQICEKSRKSFDDKVHISASVGIAVYPRDGTNFETLYKNADATLYQIKESGRNNFRFFSNATIDVGETIKSNGITTKRNHILIVEDNSMDSDLLAAIFDRNFIVEKSNNGVDALKYLKRYSHSISLILLDLFMPEMDGFAVLKKLSEDPNLNTIPVVVVSSDESRETCLKAVKSGATDFVTKPIDTNILMQRVKAAIEKNK